MKHGKTIHRKEEQVWAKWLSLKQAVNVRNSESPTGSCGVPSSAAPAFANGGGIGDGN